MTRRWLILADILVFFLLFVSFTLFYLYPPSFIQTTKKKETKIVTSGKYVIKGNLPLPTVELNDTMDFETLRRLGQVCSAKEYIIEKNLFLKESLNQRLKTLSVNIGNPVFIRIFKDEAILEVWIEHEGEYKHLKDYRICAYSGYLGPKLKEGDRQAPEGFYKVGAHQLNPNSKYHLSFNLGYPNAYDRAHGRTGSFLMVHGNCVSIGCYAMTDEKIEEIYALVEGALKNGQKYVAVHAYPFRMTQENMNVYEGNRWYDFWINLKEGYDYFESERRPPKIKVENKRYEVYE